MKKLLVGVVFALALSFSSLFSLQSANAAEKVDKNSDLIIDKATFYEVTKQKNLRTLSSEKIPTVKEVNKALNSMHVSKDHPYQEIDLGNGFTVEMGVSTDMGLEKITTQATQNKTASGYYAVKFTGIKLYDIRVSDNYSYEYGKKITKWESPPSASASGFAGWNGKITSKKLQTLTKRLRMQSPILITRL
ncbi:hypothetical protein KM873_07020 [Bacillus subtilis]|uniref:hypothetical protein n=1 Tax=Bacillus subtilis TaxID=1423 RepID=UPI001C241288|nr:hypothetical protein [Bacillus subtilis]MBU8676593.1 hypothetical protein [Bacillus subtilis]